MIGPSFRQGSPRAISIALFCNDEGVHMTWHTRAAVLDTLLFGTGACLLVAGLLTASSGLYLSGLILATAVVAGTCVFWLRRRVRWLRWASGIAVTAVLIAAGVVWPHVALTAEFDGVNVRWELAAAGDQNFTLSQPVQVDDVLVVPGIRRDRVLSLRDGHQIAKIEQGQDFTIAQADHRIVVMPRSGSAGREVSLYDTAGKRLWMKPGTSALAYADGITVVENTSAGLSGVTETAYADDGAQVWQRTATAAVLGIPTFQQQPARNMDKGTVLPTMAVWKQGAAALFVDPATGRVVKQFDNNAAFIGVVDGATIVVANPDHPGSTATISWPGTATSDVEQLDPGAHPTAAIGRYVFFDSQLDGPGMLDVGQVPSAYTTRRRALQQTVVGQGVPAPSGRFTHPPATAGEVGRTSTSGAVISGQTWDSTSNWWRSITRSDACREAIGGRTVMVTCALPRTNPLDPSVGYRREDVNRAGIDETIDRDVDQDVAVLSLLDGTEHGHVRVHSLSDAVSVADGAAVIFADDTIRLVGRPQ